MKKLVELGLMVSLLGGIVVAPSLVAPQAAYALSEDEALKRLEPIPVFAVTNQEGIPILASVPSPKDKTKQVQVATFFMSQDDAKTLVSTLKTQKPEIGNSAKIVPLSMRQAYEIKTKNKEKADTLLFEFLPPKQQLDAAVAVLKQNGQNVESFNDIPLFYAVGGADKGLLTIEQAEQKVIPFYFSQADLQGMITQLKEKNPELGKTTKIEVTSLSKIVDSLMKENGDGIQQITLVPDRAALQYALEQQKSGAKPATGGGAGATSPAAK